jgi:DNA-binding response OmpR family regulator
MIKVLLIDDSTELLELFVLLLNTDKYQVETAPSKDKGWDKLLTFNPDVVLLDVLIDGQDSRNLCLEIKQHTSYKNTPVILLSADPELLRDYEECRAFDVIEKPFSINTVTQKIDVALLKHSTTESCGVTNS